MDALTALLTRRSTVVALQGTPGPSEEELTTLLTVATRVPDHGKLTPWRIQILREAGQQALGQLLGELFRRRYPQANDKQIAFEQARPARAPLLLVVSTRLRPGHKIPEMEQLLSGGAVCYAILLAAHSLGYAAQWITEWPAYDEAVMRHLGHDPATDRILGFLHIGSRTETVEDRPRPALDEVVSEWRGPIPADAAEKP